MARRNAVTQTAEIVVRGGTLVDETGERRGDVLVRAGRIAAVEEVIEAPSGATVLDAGGCVVTPGLVDVHAHLREPGGEIAETVESGSRAAALGGYTAVVAMPNTEPAIDSAAVARDVLALGETALAEIAVAGAITIGRRGERLVPMAELAALGVRLFTDDGRGVQHAGLMRRALEYASGLGVVLAQHCEDEQLAAGGHMNEGAWSSRLGIAGQNALAEEMMLARDLALVRLTGAPMHFLHLSTAGAIEMIRRAKADGLAVTAEVTPHHLALCDASVAGFDPVYKVNPPLRTALDVAAVTRGRRRWRRRRHRDRPCAPPARTQGGPLRRGSRRDARSRDRARCRLQHFVCEPGRGRRRRGRSRPGATGRRAGPVDAGPLRLVLLAAGSHRRARP